MDVHELPSQIEQLTRIKILHASRNHIENIPVGISKLRNLEELDLSFNKISEIPKEMFAIKKMRRLILRNNKIKDLPSEIKDWRELEELDLRENSLAIPSEILERTTEPKIIFDYYFTHLKGEKRPLNEVKVLLIGQGSVGKTSIVNQLTKGVFNSFENKTVGVAIQSWHINVGVEDVTLNLWDFGGQEIMHATHQFFLTKRSLYLIVLDTRLTAEENRLEYWLKLAQSFGGESPIIIVGNKVDQHPLDINRRDLLNKYPNIKTIVETSCYSGFGIENLQDSINNIISNIPYIRDELPLAWFSIKEKLAKMKEDYIPYEKYVAMCRKERIVDEANQRVLIRFLHDLGVVLNFQDDPRLGDTNILNPAWVTNGVYQIINSNELFQAKGVLEYDQLEQILDPIRYPKERHLFIVEMMKKFELCFEFDNQTQKYLIPDLLPKDEPYSGSWENALAFIYRYNVLPSNVISRFIVRMHPYIYENTVWRSGVILVFGKNPPNIALVTADFEDRCIKILVKGFSPTQRDAMSIIRGQFDSIHRTIPGLIISEKVPIPKHPDVEPVDYEFLLQLESNKHDIIPVMLNNNIINLRVRDLLNGLGTVAARQSRNENAHLTQQGEQTLSDLTNLNILALPQNKYLRFLYMIFVYPAYILGQFFFDLIASGKKISNTSKLIAGYFLVLVVVLLIWGVVSIGMLKEIWRFFFPVK